MILETAVILLMSKTSMLTFTKFVTLGLMLHGGRTIFCGCTSGSFPHPLLPLLWNKLLMIRPFCHAILNTGALRLKSQIIRWCLWSMLSSKGFTFCYASSYVCDLSIRINSKMLPMWRVATFRLYFKESLNGCQSSDLCSFCSAVHLFIHTGSNVDSWKNILQVISAFTQEQVFF
jgi:hypothetical protein